MSLTQAEANLVAETTVARLRAEFGDQAPVLVPPATAETAGVVAPDRRHPMTGAAYDLAMERAASAAVEPDETAQTATAPEAVDAAGDSGAAGADGQVPASAPQVPQAQAQVDAKAPGWRRLGLRLLASVWDFARLALAAFAAQLAATGTGHLDAKGLASLALGALEAGYRQYVVSRAPAASAALAKSAADPERVA